MKQFILFEIEYKGSKSNAVLLKQLLAFIDQVKKSVLAKSEVSVLPPVSPRIGILYSANNEQAFAFQESYFTHQLPVLEGSGQAELFRELVSHIKANALYEELHVLPIATSLAGGKNDVKNIVNKGIIQRDLSNIDAHLRRGFYIIALVPPLNDPRYIDDPKYLIGGGSSRYFYDTRYASVLFEHQTYSQGRYVQAMLDLMADGYNEKDMMALNRLKAGLGMPLINADNAAYFLGEALRQALVSKSHLSVAYANHVISLSLSASYNLRIQCLMDSQPGSSAIDKIQQVLAPYGVQRLNQIRKQKVLKQEQIRVIDSQEGMLSIPHDHVYSFLSTYCELPLISLRSLYETEFAARRAKPCEVVIRSCEIVMGSRIYTLEELIRSGKAGYSKKTWTGAQKAARQRMFKEQLHPEQIAPALKSLMIALREEEQRDLSMPQASSPALPSAVRYRYRPLITVDSMPRSGWGGEIALREKLFSLQRKQSAGEVGDALQSLTAEVSAYLHWQVCHRFNTLSEALLQQYAALWPDYTSLGPLGFFSEKNPVPSRSALNHFCNQWAVFTLQHIDEREPTRGLIRYWIERQVALLAYIKGNYVLFATLWSILYPAHERLKTFPMPELGLVNFLDKKKSSPVQLKEKQQEYHREYGICLPYLYPYSKHAVFEQSREGIARAQLEATLDQELTPLLQEIAEFTPFIDKLRLERDEELLTGIRAVRVMPDDTPLLKQRWEGPLIAEYHALWQALQTFSLWQRLQQTVQTVARVFDLSLVEQEESAFCESLLSHFGKLFSLQNSLGKEKLAFVLALHSRDIRLAEDLLFFNLSRLSTADDSTALADLQEDPLVREDAKTLMTRFLHEETAAPLIFAASLANSRDMLFAASAPAASQMSKAAEKEADSAALSSISI